MPVPRLHFCTSLGCSFGNIHIHCSINNRPLSFVFSVFHMTSERITFKIIITYENDNSHRRNDSPTGNIDNLIGFSKKC